MSVIRNHLVLVISAIIIVIIIATGFIPRPVLVDIALATRDPMRVTIEEEGKTRVTDRYILSAPVDGFVRRINLNVGDRVAENQAVAYLEPLPSSVLDPRSRAEAEAKIVAARAALSATEKNAHGAQIDAQHAATEHARLKILFESNTVSLERYQQSSLNARRTKTNHESALFKVKVAKSELKAAQIALHYSVTDTVADSSATVTIKAPVQGNVLTIHRKSEGVVRKGEALLEVGDSLSLEVEVDVLSRDAVKISPGTKVEFDRWGGNEMLEGVVRTVEPVGFTRVSALGVEEQRVLVIIDLLSAAEKWRRLGDGYRMETLFILWQDNNVLQVPTSALFRNQGAWSLFIVENNIAKIHNVEPGRRSGISTQIIFGVNEGDKIINHPGRHVEDGIRVRYL